MKSDALKNFVESHRRRFVLTGAGCSTNSGIPNYRDSDGNWKRTQPVRFQAFVAEDATRRRYWARSMIGWRRFGQALPNDAHHALARLEANDHARRRFVGAQGRRPLRGGFVVPAVGRAVDGLVAPQRRRVGQTQDPAAR
jgi:Sir2 family